MVLKNTNNATDVIARSKAWHRVQCDKAISRYPFYQCIFKVQLA